MTKYRVPLYVFFIIFFSLISSFCLAGISIDPETIEKVGKQGEQIKDFITITNNQEKPVDVKVTLSDWLKQKIDPGKWLKVEPVEISLNPGESKKVAYTVDVLSGIKGELMSMVFFTISDKGKERTTVGMQIGIPLYVAVENTVDYKIEIESCKLQLEDKYLKGDILISNMSNVHIRPKVEALLDGLDKSIYPVAYTSYGTSIRAGQRKYFSFLKEVKGYVPKHCKVTVIVNYGIGGRHDCELERTFDIVNINREDIEGETAQDVEEDK